MNKLGTGKVLRKFQTGLFGLNRNLAVISTNFFQKDVFDAQGFIDYGVNRWKPKEKGAGRTLVKTGRGRRSIRPEQISSKGAKVVAGAYYMKYHNEGTGRLPQRKFMGASKTLDRRCKSEILDFLDTL